MNFDKGRKYNARDENFKYLIKITVLLYNKLKNSFSYREIINDRCHLKYFNYLSGYVIIQPNYGFQT